DDNFNSIDKAILYGRTIFNSIRKFIIFQLTINVAAVLISFICPLLNLNSPLNVIQILWVNLVMDTLAALAFGGEPALKRFMQEKPKRRTEPIISKNMMSEIIVGAGWTFILSLVMLLLGEKIIDAPTGLTKLEVWNLVRPSENHIYLTTAYFAFFIFIAVFNGFNARTEKLNLFDNLTKNKGFLTVFGIIALVQIAMTYIGVAVPAVGDILGCHGLNLIEWLVILVMSLSIIPIDLIRKAIVKAVSKK
ncbi:MAG: cation transporting ATPase C-terminal domain-containing protein, partial [Oscillospiraceae bacterium]